MENVERKKHAFYCHFTSTVVKNLSNDDVLDSLLEMKILTHEERYERIQNLSNRKNRSSFWTTMETKDYANVPKLIRLLEQAVGQGQAELVTSMKEYLLETDPHLAEKYNFHSSPDSAAASRAYVLLASGSAMPILVEYFIERESVTEELHEKVTARPTGVNIGSRSSYAVLTSLSGLGGIGKTMLARKYVDHFRKWWKAACAEEGAPKSEALIFWFEAETKESLESAFRSLAKSYKLPELVDTKALVQSVYRCVVSHTCLFVFDNVTEHDGSNGIVDFLPHPSPGPHHYILATSRKIDLVPYERVLLLGVLTEEESVELVGQALPQSSTESRKQLCKILGCLPLALQQAIAYIRQSLALYDSETCATEAYVREYKTREQLDNQTKKLLEFECLDGDGRKNRQTVYVTWQMTMEAIEKCADGDFAYLILRCLAYLNPENVELSLLSGIDLRFDDGSNLRRAVRSWNRDPYEPTAADRGRTNAAAQLLSKYSMITLKDARVSVHRLVQDVVRLQNVNANNRRGVNDLKLLSRIGDSFRSIKRGLQNVNASNGRGVNDLKLLSRIGDSFRSIKRGLQNVNASNGRGVNERRLLRRIIAYIGDSSRTISFEQRALHGVAVLQFYNEYDQLKRHFPNFPKTISEDQQLIELVLRKLDSRDRISALRLIEAAGGDTAVIDLVLQCIKNMHKEAPNEPIDVYVKKIEQLIELVLRKLDSRDRLSALQLIETAGGDTSVIDLVLQCIKNMHKEATNEPIDVHVKNILELIELVLRELDSRDRLSALQLIETAGGDTAVIDLALQCIKNMHKEAPNELIHLQLKYIEQLIELVLRKLESRDRLSALRLIETAGGDTAVIDLVLQCIKNMHKEAPNEPIDVHVKNILQLIELVLRKLDSRDRLSALRLIETSGGDTAVIDLALQCIKNMHKEAPNEPIDEHVKKILQLIELVLRELESRDLPSALRLIQAAGGDTTVTYLALQCIKNMHKEAPNEPIDVYVKKIMQLIELILHKLDSRDRISALRLIETFGGDTAVIDLVLQCIKNMHKEAPNEPIDEHVKNILQLIELVLRELESRDLPSALRLIQAAGGDTAVIGLVLQCIKNMHTDGPNEQIDVYLKKIVQLTAFVLRKLNSRDRLSALRLIEAAEGDTTVINLALQCIKNMHKEAPNEPIDVHVKNILQLIELILHKLDSRDRLSALRLIETFGGDTAVIDLALQCIKNMHKEAPNEPIDEHVKKILQLIELGLRELESRDLPSALRLIQAAGGDTTVTYLALQCIKNMHKEAPNEPIDVHVKNILQLIELILHKLDSRDRISALRLIETFGGDTAVIDLVLQCIKNMHKEAPNEPIDEHVKKILQLIELVLRELESRDLPSALRLIQAAGGDTTVTYLALQCIKNMHKEAPNEPIDVYVKKIMQLIELILHKLDSRDRISALRLIETFGGDTAVIDLVLQCIKNMHKEAPNEPIDEHVKNILQLIELVLRELESRDLPSALRLIQAAGGDTAVIGLVLQCIKNMHTDGPNEQIDVYLKKIVQLTAFVLRKLNSRDRLSALRLIEAAEGDTTVINLVLQCIKNMHKEAPNEPIDEHVKKILQLIELVLRELESRDLPSALRLIQAAGGDTTVTYLALQCIKNMHKEAPNEPIDVHVKNILQLIELILHKLDSRDRISALRLIETFGGDTAVIDLVLQCIKNMHKEAPNEPIDEHVKNILQLIELVLRELESRDLPSALRLIQAAGGDTAVIGLVLQCIKNMHTDGPNEQIDVYLKKIVQLTAFVLRKLNSRDRLSALRLIEAAEGDTTVINLALQCIKNMHKEAPNEPIDVYVKKIMQLIAFVLRKLDSRDRLSALRLIETFGGDTAVIDLVLQCIKNMHKEAPNEPIDEHVKNILQLIELILRKLDSRDRLSALRLIETFGGDTAVIDLVLQCIKNMHKEAPNEPIDEHVKNILQLIELVLRELESRDRLSALRLIQAAAGDTTVIDLALQRIKNIHTEAPNEPIDVHVKNILQLIELILRKLDSRDRLSALRLIEAAGGDTAVIDLALQCIKNMHKEGPNEPRDVYVKKIVRLIELLYPKLDSRDRLSSLRYILSA